MCLSLAPRRSFLPVARYDRVALTVSRASTSIEAVPPESGGEDEEYDVDAGDGDDADDLGLDDDDAESNGDIGAA